MAAPTAQAKRTQLPFKGSQSQTPGQNTIHIQVSPSNQNSSAEKWKVTLPNMPPHSINLREIYIVDARQMFLCVAVCVYILINAIILLHAIQKSIQRIGEEWSV